MKNNIKFWFLGFFSCFILCGICFAATSLSDVFISTFPIKINNVTYTPEMPVLNYQGRTYLALREFGTATNNTIDFSNNTIFITTSSAPASIENSNNSNKNVYITSTGSKYHYNNNCNGGTYTSTTLDNAVSRNFTPCLKCVK